MSSAEINITEGEELLVVDSGQDIIVQTPSTELLISGPSLNVQSLPGGSNTQVQYNDGGVMGGASGATYNDGTGELSVPLLTINGGRLTIDADSDTYLDGSVDDVAVWYASGAEQGRWTADGLVAAKVKLNSGRLVIDSDEDTYLDGSDDLAVWYVSGAEVGRWTSAGLQASIDLNGGTLTADADGDTYLDASTDDQLDWYAAGAKVGEWSANGLDVTSRLRAGTVSGGAHQLTGTVEIVGDSDTEQLVIKADVSQSNTNPMLVLQNSVGAVMTALHSDDPTNLFLGNDCGVNNTTGTRNVFMGSSAGTYNSSGGYNFALGSLALYYNQAGSNNTVIGAFASFGSPFQSPSNNTLIGLQSGYGVVAGTQNIGVGNNTLYYLGAGDSNTVIGYESGKGASGFTVNELTAIGWLAANVNQGSYNTVIGSQAARYVTGDRNTVIGRLVANSLLAGDDNIIIGESVDVSAAGVSDELNIGDLITGSMAAPKSVVLDTDSVTVTNSQSPASGGTGTAGEIAWDANYIYVCTATNTWKRAALTGGY